MVPAANTIALGGVNYAGWEWEAEWGKIPDEAPDCELKKLVVAGEKC